jgi:hypothetical protein
MSQSGKRQGAYTKTATDRASQGPPTDWMCVIPASPTPIPAKQSLAVPSQQQNPPDDDRGRGLVTFPVLRSLYLFRSHNPVI